MVSIRAHFDGRVFVPAEPVNVPPNSEVRLLLVEETDGDRPLMGLLRAAAQAPDDSAWPADGAAEHDHYLYGWPKQEP